MEIDLKRLAEPFPPDAVSWRVGSTTKDKSKGMALAYIDSRDVQNRLDDVCGPENWQVRFPWSDGKALACEIGIRIGDEWVWKGDGAGATDVEADKGRFSDALKRAAVHWRIGRYLYDLDSPWVALEPAGNSYKIAPGEMQKLRALLAKNAPRVAPAEPPQTRKAETPQTQAAKPPPPANGAPKPKYPVIDLTGEIITEHESGRTWEAEVRALFGKLRPEERSDFWTLNLPTFRAIYAAANALPAVQKDQVVTFLNKLDDDVQKQIPSKLRGAA